MFIISELMQQIVNLLWQILCYAWLKRNICGGFDDREIEEWMFSPTRYLIGVLPLLSCILGDHLRGLVGALIGTWRLWQIVFHVHDIIEILGGFISLKDLFELMWLCTYPCIRLNHTFLLIWANLSYSFSREPFFCGMVCCCPWNIIKECIALENATMWELVFCVTLGCTLWSYGLLEDCWVAKVSFKT